MAHSDGAKRTTEATDYAPQWGASYCRKLASWQLFIWTLVGAGMVGDLATTAYGLHIGLVEKNPVAAQVLQIAGIGGLVGLKLIALAFALVCWKLLPRDYEGFVPLGFALPQLIAVVANTVVIASIS